MSKRTKCDTTVIETASLSGAYNVDPDDGDPYQPGARNRVPKSPWNATFKVRKPISEKVTWDGTNA